MSNDVYSTLQGLLTSSSTAQALLLASDTFAGPIQSAISDYLSGISLQFGPYATLTTTSAGKLQFTAKLGSDSEASLVLAPIGESGATLTLSGGESGQGSVVLTFTQADGQVQMTLDATMATGVAWPLSDLWPKLLDWAPANQVDLVDGALQLQYVTDGTIDFSGSGSFTYKGSDFLDAALDVRYGDGKTDVMLGAVVGQWSPGSLWSALDGLTFDNSGFVVSTVDGSSSDLAPLDLADRVEAIGTDFTIQAGILLFTSVELSGTLASLGNLLGDAAPRLDLLATYAKADGTKSIEAVITGPSSGSGNGVFRFDDLSLDWTLDGDDFTIAASAEGTFNPDANTSIDLTLTGSIQSGGADMSLTFEISEWAQPFGIPTVTIDELECGLTVSPEGGVDFTAGADITLRNPNVPQYEFEVGAMIEVADFETPNGIAVWTKADQEPMTLSNVWEAAFAIDISPAALEAEGEDDVAAIVEVLDDMISIKQFTFWAVEGPPMSIGPHGPFPSGFGLQAAFTLFGQDDVAVSATLAEKADASAGFSGYITVQDAVGWGSVFTLSGWDPNTQAPTSGGPQFAIAATPDGIVVPGVNDGQAVRLYSSLNLQFLDVVDDHLYALVTEDGYFDIDCSVQDGVQAGGCGCWIGSTVEFVLDPSNYGLSASFSFAFGWENVDWGGLTLWGVQLCPSLVLPNFSVVAGLDVTASEKTLEVAGYFGFNLFSIDLQLGTIDNPYVLFDVDVQGIVTTLDDVSRQLRVCIRQKISGLMETALDDIDDFVSWAKDYWTQFTDELSLIANIIVDHFDKGGLDLLNALLDLGATATEVKHVMEDLGYSAEQVAEWLSDAADCAITNAASLLPSLP